MDFACTIFFTKKYGRCDIFIDEGVFSNRQEHFKSVISACGTTLLLDINKSLSKDQSNGSILSRDHKFI